MLIIACKEINVTSPTCIREIEAAYPINISGKLMDAIEENIRKKQQVSSFNQSVLWPLSFIEVEMDSLENQFLDYAEERQEQLHRKYKIFGRDNEKLSEI